MGSLDWPPLIKCAVSVFHFSGSLSTLLLLCFLNSIFSQLGQAHAETSELLVTLNWPCIPGAVTHQFHRLVTWMNMFWCCCLTLLSSNKCHFLPVVRGSCSQQFQTLTKLWLCAMANMCMQPLSMLIINPQLLTIIWWQNVKGEHPIK